MVQTSSAEAAAREQQESAQQNGKPADAQQQQEVCSPAGVKRGRAPAQKEDNGGGSAGDAPAQPSGTDAPQEGEDKAANSKKPRMDQKPAGKGGKGGRGAQKKAAAAAGAEGEVKQEEENGAEEAANNGAAETSGAGSGRRRAATQATKAYKDTGPTVRASKEDYVVKKEEAVCPSEAAALEETGGGAAGARRRLLDFGVVDGQGNAQPLERALLLEEPTFVTGVICPTLDPNAKGSQKGLTAAKERERGRRVEGDRFGPLKEWRVAYSKAGPQVVLKTATALYECVRPAASYRKTFAPLDEQLAICHQVYLALCPDVGGNVNASYEEVVAKLARTKVTKGYGSVREALLVNAKFVLGQLEAMNAGLPLSRNMPNYRRSPFAQAMEAEVAKGPYVSRTMTNGIMIQDGAEEAPPKKSSGDARADALAEADEDMARRLQSKMDAQAFGTAAGGGRKSSSAPSYIRISEQEIADDYPLPKQYNKEVEETDELLMADPDDLMNVDPDQLPRRMLHDFAFYNSEGFLSTLELVPMFTGVDHDVDIFGSGVVAEEDEADYTAGGVPTHAAAAEQQKAGSSNQDGTGSSRAGGSSSGAADAGAPTQRQQPEGMRVYLSQIREWCVECGCDMLFISIRTDVAWYRLAKPADQYAPWYATVLKAAQLAVAILGMLEEESRASRLSFTDITRRLAELPESAPAFLSKKPEGVERFVVVHGQIILNQFRHYPNKAVQRSAFTADLRQRMETRKHHKLYMSKAKAVKAAKAPRNNANPMRNRAASGLRAKPMPATATNMVKAVWHNYFFGNSVAAQIAKQAEAAQQQQGGDAQGVDAGADAPAKEVEEDENEEEEEEAGGEENALAGSAKNSAAARRVAQSIAQRKQKQKQQAEAAAKEQAEGASTSAQASGSGKRAQPNKPAKAAKRTIEWTSPGKPGSNGRTLYTAAKVGDVDVQLGDVVKLPAEDSSEEEGGASAAAAAAAAGVLDTDVLLGNVVCLFEEEGEKMAQVRVMLHGHETVLGDVAADCELFLTESTEVHALADVMGKLNAKHLVREWRWENRLQYFKEDEELRKRNEEHRAAQQPLEYLYRHLYRPEHGMFCAIPSGMLPAQGQAEPADLVQEPEEPIALGLLPSNSGFIKEGVEYKLGDFIYLHPQTFESLAEEEAADAKNNGAANGTAQTGKKQGRQGGKGGRAARSGGGRRCGRGARAQRDSDAESSSSEEEQEQEGEGSEEGAAADEKQQQQQKGGRGSRGGRAPARGRKRGAGGEAKEQQQQQQQQQQQEQEQGAAGAQEEREDAKGTEKEAKGRRGGGSRAGRHKGSHEGLKAFCIGQLVSVEGRGKVPSQLTMRRVFRPEDISQDLAYRSGWWDVYMATPGADLVQVDPDAVVSKCAAVVLGEQAEVGDTGSGLHTFRVVGSLDPARPKDLLPPPSTLKLGESGQASSSKGRGTPKKGTAPQHEQQQSQQQQEASSAAGASCTVGGGGGAGGPSAVAMRSLDIFAGCGGLSEGMHQAGVAESKWAIEYEQPAAEAFKLNYPDAKVFCNNCNVLLMAAMAKANLLHDCDACEDCTEAVSKLPQDYIADLPSPGDVEFMMGGPPCQGYSGMNRFNKGNWSMVQNSMVMAYLSYCDFYRPRYFLLENVRNFVSHNKSFTFRLTLRTLLDMGYQVRFGVLNAGNYGVPQSRKRTIIWAAAPNEVLPEWPKQQHVFHSPQLTVNLPGGVAYTAVPHPPGNGAPLRAVTVRDAIADLPPISNGCSTQEQPYGGQPESAYQHFVRGNCTTLKDHICKEMNELNLERCKCIPKNTPGADWRVLMDIVAADESRREFKGQALVPWCLPHTMERHNGWRGLYGRLDAHGHFPTSVTDPQPMGKVGQVFHPSQDRIVSVRECARSQGFPDSFTFSGNVHNKHRQVGNAVPPPLACALGKQLRVVLEATRQERINAAMAAQW